MGADGRDASAGSTVRREPVTILYGTATGHAESVARALEACLAEAGAATVVADMEAFDPRRLAGCRWVFAVVSTHGEGDPPDGAVSFFQFLRSGRAPRLTGVRYAVLALGDRTYEHFCQAGKDLDARLAELGASRVAPLGLCDVDYEEEAARWITQVVARWAAASLEAAQVLSPPAPSVRASAERAPGSDARHAVWAEVLENLVLNGRGSDKETRHLEVAWQDDWAPVEPGDALAVFPQNDPDLVDALLAATGWDPEEPVAVGPDGPVVRLREALLERYEITSVRPQLVGAVAQAAGRRAVVGAGEAPGDVVQGRDVLDVVQDFGLAGCPPAVILPHLAPLRPRQYSVASSLRYAPGEVHLTVRVVRYAAGGRRRSGVCSGYLADRVRPGDRLRVFVEANRRFKLPPDPDAPVIMIGPGTGVAPFRAFLQEREATGARGPTWLFFGDRRFRTDFLYQTEWLRWLGEGVLTRMDVAFSRDGPRKVYVQDRLREHARDVYAWLEAGAYVYVCGDAARMAPEVDRTLREIVASVRGGGPDAAEAYLRDLAAAGRLRRDVY
ncbi:MAG: flavodoxin domain-containing protein [Actinomycetia bacterium]|nr:flavodoxin domain-containing protein [Actinomycetes bacterium]